MRVNCENCDSSFNLDEGRVKSTGSKVRCSKCRHVFVVYPPKPEEDEAKPADALEDVSASEAPMMDETSSGEAEDLDLSDIEKMLEIEEKPDTPPDELEESLPQEDAGSGDGDASLDLTDIEKILDEEDESDELAEDKADGDEDLVFDLDEALDADSRGEQITPTTELDLGDLEKMFETDEEPESAMDEELESPVDEEASLSLGLEAEEDLSLKPAGEEAEAGEELSLEPEEDMIGAEPEESGEALGFDVETTEEDEEAPALDLEIKDEDIASEETPESPVKEAQEVDLEATISIDTSEEVSEAPAAQAEELDLEATIQIDSEALEPETGELDLETTMKLDADSLAPETEELDLSMEDVSETSDVEETAIGMDEPSGDELEIELEIDEEDVEDVGGISEEDLESEALEDGLADFGEDEDMEYPDDSVPDIPDEEDVFDEEAPDLEEDQEAEEDFEEVAVEASSGGGLKKFFIFLSVVLVIVVLLAALWFLNFKGIVSVPYLDQIEIPFLSKTEAPQVVDSGSQDISYEVDPYRFIETEKAGKLLLITGKVKNEYSMSRSYIQMSGSLYDKGEMRTDTATAFCGNIIADLELKQMTPAAIRTRLGNRSGENNSNVNIKPGEERPFMIVFFNLPESLDHFTVAVAGSSAGAS